MNVFPDDLVSRYHGTFGGVRVDELLRDFRYFSSFGIVLVPKGFLTDGASIPRVFWPLLGPHGDYFRAAVVHDFLYSPRNDEFSRAEADLIFREAMYNTGVPWCRREVIYAAVRLFGKRAFRGGVK